ncbi:MAG: ATP-binding protein [Pseudomonadota bacterium]
MRLTIARKIALAVIAIVILCVGTMAWVTSSNLQRGFIAYLNQMQERDLEQVGELLARRYRTEGDFEWLRGDPRAMREVLGQLTPQIQAEGGPERRRRPQPRDDGYGPPPRRDGPPREAMQPPGARDPMGIGSRLSIFDNQGRPLVGPPDVPSGIARAIVVDGKSVAMMRLRPLRQSGNADANAAGFLREQVRDIVIVAFGMVLVSVLLAFWLARHLLRPVAALRDVTARLARSQFDARAPLLSRDELAELALHVNAMAEALETSERNRRKMLADVAHELRTPLTVIRGEIEALIDGIRTADPQALQSLHAEVLHLNKLVDDLHQLTLADAGDLHFAWQNLDLAALVAPLLERYHARASDAGLALTRSLPALPLNVKGDPGRLTQVIVNLLENSVRYTDAGGQIHVELARDGGEACLVIEDSAPGVPDGQHDAIFDRLYRIDAARSRERGGSGLGLSICKALAEAHGGSIAAARSRLGGVRVTLRLPIANL